jgi:nucleoside-diphosphate-sugar epimerase
MRRLIEAMQNNHMPSADHMRSILVTGASGHIGSETCRVLRTGGRVILPIDVEPDSPRGVLACDLTLKDELSRLFQVHPIQTVIHLAGLLPSAFRSDPLKGAEVNLNGSLELMRQAVNSGVRRFVFASSISVYGSSPSAHPLTEDDPATPDEPYGASKRAVELIGETLAAKRALEFASLRIARVIGPGIKKTASPWRSQIFAPLPRNVPIRIPFAPEAMLSLVHVEDVARMLFVLGNATEVRSCVYNTPAELWQARDLKQLIEESVDTRVELGDDRSSAGPTCDGGRFLREFGFELQGLRERLSRRKVNKA